jgi:Uncharacterized conserved protein (DUF2075)
MLAKTLGSSQSRTKAHEEEHAVFLSGNGPLAEEVREALMRDERARLIEQGHKTKKSDAARKVNSFVQNIMHFRDSNVATTDPPIERVAVLDEAQRAWDVKPEGINAHEKIEATTWFLKEGMAAAAPDATAPQRCKRLD